MEIRKWTPNIKRGRGHTDIWHAILSSFRSYKHVYHRLTLPTFHFHIHTVFLRQVINSPVQPSTIRIVNLSLIIRIASPSPVIAFVSYSSNRRTNLSSAIHMLKECNIDFFEYVHTPRPGEWCHLRSSTPRHDLHPCRLIVLPVNHAARLPPRRPHDSVPPPHSLMHPSLRPGRRCHLCTTSPRHGLHPCRLIVVLPVNHAARLPPRRPMIQCLHRTH